MVNQMNELSSPHLCEEPVNMDRREKNFDKGNQRLSTQSNVQSHGKLLKKMPESFELCTNIADKLLSSVRLFVCLFVLRTPCAVCSAAKILFRSCSSYCVHRTQLQFVSQWTLQCLCYRITIGCLYRDRCLFLVNVRTNSQLLVQCFIT